MVFIRYLRANRSGPLFTLAWQLGFTAFGILFVLIINTFLNDEPNYACMGSLFALIATLIGVLARGNVTGQLRFHMAVAMGNTRRSYLLGDWVVALINCAVGLAFAWCVYQGENALYQLIYPGFVNDMPLDGFYRWKIMLPVVFAVLLLDMVLTALTVRFGSKTFRVVWLCMCFSFMIFPRAIEAYQEGGNSIFARVGGAIMWLVTVVPVGGWIALGVAAVAALVIFSACTLQKAEVKL